MDNKILSSHFFETLSTIHYVENQLQHPISRKAFGHLFAQLETVQKTCVDEELIYKIKSLYGKIVDRFLLTEVEEICNLAKKPKINAKLVEKKIQDLKQFGLSQKHFVTVTNIENMLQNNLLPTVNPQIGIEEIPLESVEELFELSKAIYQEDQKKIAKLKQLLNPCAEKCLKKHLSAQNTFFLEDKISTIQALFASAYELSGTCLSQYPSKEEIDSFFHDLQISCEDL